MLTPAQLWRRLRLFVFREQSTRDLEDELRLHRALRSAALRDSGLNEVEAHHAAARRFGNITSLTEWSRDMWGFASLDTLRLDLRYAIRALAKTPAFTGAALATLTLGIGATTLIYALAHALWLKPLPYAEPERLVTIRDTYTTGAGANISVPEIDDLARLHSFDGVAAFHYGASIARVGDESIRLVVYRGTSNLFSVLGTTPALGRTFAATDRQQEHGAVVVVSDAFWRNHMNADAHAIGTPFRLYGQDYTIIGVMPRGFQFPQTLSADMWILTDPEAGAGGDRARRIVQAIARLKLGVTLSQAATEVAVLDAQLAASFPATNRGWRIKLVELVEDTVGSSRQAFGLLLGTVGFLLLIACANTAGLFLARNASRQNEMALRAALGASRSRLIGQFFTEAMTIAVIGGLAGLALAYLGAHVMAGVLPSRIPRVGEIAIDGNTIVFTVAISVVSGILCALAPASRISVSSPGDALKGVARGVIGGKHRLQYGLIVTEVALSLVLLVGSGLMLQSLVELLGRDRGFAPARVLAFHLTVPFERFGDQNARAELYRTTIASLSRLPGVEAVGEVTGYPASNLGYRGFGMVSSEPATGTKGVQSVVHLSSPDYFRAMTVPLRAGRFFTDEDRAGSPNVVIVNQSLAKQLWPDGNAVGRLLRVPSEIELSNLPYEVVGVVGDMRVGRTAAPELFIPTAQSPAFWTDIVVKTTGDPDALAASVRAALKAVEKDFLIEQMVPMKRILTDLYALQRTQSIMTAIFAIVAATLAAVGLFGLLSHLVGQRIREIGIRMALGARQVDVFRTVVARGLALTGVGVAAGAGGAYVLIQALRTSVFGLAKMNPTIFAGASATLLVVAFLACTWPARRATQVDPVDALR